MVWLKSKEKNGASGRFDTLRGLGNYAHSPVNRTTFIKRMDFNSLHQVDEIKEQLSQGHILILDASLLLKAQKENLMELKRGLDNIRRFCEHIGGSMGRIREKMLIVTPSPYIKIH